MSIKGRNSLANLRKTSIYNTKVDLVDDNVFTKFGLNQSIRFKDIEQPEDQWSCKRSPDYFLGITTTVKQEKGATSIF